MRRDGEGGSGWGPGPQVGENRALSPGQRAPGPYWERGPVTGARTAATSVIAKPELGRIAVKVVNHLGDEVMKVFKGMILTNLSEFFSNG